MAKSNQTDPELGLAIHHYLIEKQVETPMSAEYLRKQHEQFFTPSEYEVRVKNQNQENIEACLAQVMTSLGLNLTDDSLRGTPQRIAKMFLNEIFWGLDCQNFPKITTIENTMQYDEMVLEKGIQVNSFCEHHFVPIDGRCHIAYIPKFKVIGLSKLNRVVDYFARRPQVQERLTEQIYHALSYILGTEDVAVMIEATHYCVKFRGIEHQNCITTTSRLGGSFKSKPETRNEFINLIK